MENLEQYFQQFRKNIIGIDHSFEGPFGSKKVIYADWTASGRLYKTIEDILTNYYGPYVANTHTETTYTGTSMTKAYHHAREVIKKHVNANQDDCIIAFGSGMTAAVNKFQRILGLRVPEHLMESVHIPKEEIPLIIVTHMEHHSNQTSWLETIADVVQIAPDANGLVDLSDLERLLVEHADRKFKYAAVTACSNVTGIKTEYHKIAELMHKAGGLCFVDFACCAPYTEINMHPENELQHLDAIYFSPHKFLGGPGTPGILIFNKHLYHNRIPDHPGGGTVKWTNPWNEHSYLDDIEDREDGGTPPFLQTIKTAYCIQLKEQMGVDNIMKREHELLDILFKGFQEIPGLHILADNIKERLCIISFYIDGLHYNLCVKLLNDLFGIQSRGGCSCAGTYGHYLFNISYDLSHDMTKHIDEGDNSVKLGWIRVSLHPTNTNAEAQYVVDAIKYIAAHHTEHVADYEYEIRNNEFVCKKEVKELAWEML